MTAFLPCLQKLAGGGGLALHHPPSPPPSPQKKSNARASSAKRERAHASQRLAQVGRRKDRTSHYSRGQGGAIAKKSHATIPWLWRLGEGGTGDAITCELRMVVAAKGAQKSKIAHELRMLQRCPHPRTGGSPSSSPGNSKALLRVFPPHRLGRFTSWCAPCHGCGDRDERKEQQRLWRPRGAKTAHVLKLRS